MESVLCEELFDLGHSLLGEVLGGRYPWEVLGILEEEIWRLGACLDKDIYDEVWQGVWVARDAKVSPSACLCPPCIVGAGSQVRQGAYIRGSALIGKGCVVGNSTEVKNAILFDEGKAPHFNYIGDSILGYKAHLGAGVVLSNVRCDKGEVVVKCQPPILTGRKKVGSFVGDGCEVGSHCVLNPGTILGRDCLVYPLTSVGGVYTTGSRIGGKHG